ncbi:hypothetical protein ACJX0J_028607, partial [Zea mays]
TGDGCAADGHNLVSSETVVEVKLAQEINNEETKNEAAAQGSVARKDAKMEESAAAAAAQRQLTTELRLSVWSALCLGAIILKAYVFQER